MNYQPPPSPIFAESSNDEISPFRTDKDKIHRIRCLVPYLASIVDVVSPSEIWIQHPNHITNKLTQVPTESVKLKPDDLKDLMYVMAPLDSSTLGRARILGIKPDAIVIVRFIDHGFLAAVKSNMLYQMPMAFRTHPWQTVPVVLFGLKPMNNEIWTKEEIQSLKSVLEKYEMFWIIPHFTKDKILDDSKYQRVTMYGLSGEDVDAILKSQDSEFMLGESVTQSYFAELAMPIFQPIPVIDALDQPVFSHNLQTSVQCYVKTIDGE
uniref:Tudor domain-containing protein n=2 Tax=Panagrolaimus sp. JU765 TaxID=591449 RepID=A0AC34R0Q1_9BILA